MHSSFAFHTATLLIETFVRSLVFCAVMGLLRLPLRRASAATRHLLWLMTLCGLLLLPLLTVVLPDWRMPVAAIPIIASVNITHQEKASVLQTQLSDPSRAGDLVGPGVENTRQEKASVLQTRNAVPLPYVRERGLSAVWVGIPAVRSAPNRGGETGVALLQISGLWQSLLALQTEPMPWFVWLTVAWLVGTVAILTRFIGGMMQVRRIQRSCCAIHEGRLFERLTQLYCDRGTRRCPELWQGMAEGHPGVPMTWGVHPPVLVLPWDAEEWTDERLRIVLLHELAHVQRYDWVWQTLAHLVCALYWFHPLAWMAANRLRLESERACDEQVLAAGVTASTYATHLLQVVRSVQRPLYATVAMGQPSQLEIRLRTILKNPGVRQGNVAVLSGAAFLAMVGIVVPLAALRPVAPSPRPVPSADLPAVLPAEAEQPVTIDRGGASPAPQPAEPAPAPKATPEPVRRAVAVHPRQSKRRIYHGLAGSAQKSARHQGQEGASPADGSDEAETLEAADVPDGPEVPDTPDEPEAKVRLNSKALSASIAHLVAGEVAHALQTANVALTTTNETLKKTHIETTKEIDHAMRDANKEIEHAMRQIHAPR